MVSDNGNKAPCGAIFVNTPFHKLQNDTATEVNLLTKGNKRGKMRQIIFKKSYIVYTLLILFSFTIISVTYTSALSYQTDVGISFTFNPTLSVSISSSDLAISNLTPGTTDTSNEISVNVSTNNIYGYNLYATVGNSTYDNTSLTRSNSNDAFTSISTTANLPSLTTDNTWGYTYSLDNSTTWSKYNGLPLYTTDNPTRLRKNTGPAEDTVNFKIAAKSSTTQPSGTYTNVINFTAITKPTPITLADAYAKEGKELYHGYYKMQDMTPTICEETEDIGSQLQVIDIRDDKVYWISKLADDNCWMTQNLDLDIDDTKIYTHYDTDLGWTTNDETATWKPTEGHSTIDFIGTTVDGWVDSNTEPYSANPGDIYYYTSNSDEKDIKYNSLQDCTNAGHNDCKHYHAGNYYNWPVAVASNSIQVDLPDRSRMPNSICPSQWRLPELYSSNEFGKLLYAQKIILSETSSGASAFTANGHLLIRQKPLYVSRVGQTHNSLQNQGDLVKYWGNQSWGSNRGYSLYFRQSTIAPRDGNDRAGGSSLRCLAR